LCNTFGGLYDWNEMMQYSTTAGSQGICPSGWHIPTITDWCTLLVYLDGTVNCGSWAWTGTNVAGKMKETGTSNWWPPNTGATNISGFTALPSGERSPDGLFFNVTNDTYFWTSSTSDYDSGVYLNLDCAMASIYKQWIKRQLAGRFVV